jgi:hypothetical protein
MKVVSYLLLGVGAVWLAVVIYVAKTGYIVGLHFRGQVNRHLALAAFYAFFCSVMFGWIVPLAIGAVLLWKRK